jgi:hypothetical protein
MAEWLGFNREEALTLGCAPAGLTAHARGILFVIFEPSVPEGLRVLAKDPPTKPESVERYLDASSAMDALGEARTATEALIGLLPPGELDRRAFRLYRQFRRRSRATRPAGLAR